MGRKTWESIPLDKRPLSNRLNVILTKNKDFVPTFSLKPQYEPIVCSSLDQALQRLSENPNVAEIFVIGGQSLFEESLTNFKHLCKLVIATRINKDFEADVSMPEMDDNFTPLFISQTYSQPKD